MLHFDKFVHSYNGNIIMSILLGIGLATFFREVCKGKHCRIISAPPVQEIDGQIYRFDDKCYKMEKNAIRCSSNKRIVKM